MSIDVYTSISMNLNFANSIEEFCDIHKNTKAFNDALNKNPNFLKELYAFINSDNKEHRSVFHVFNKELKFYYLKGFGNFFYREKDSSFIIIPAGPKITYLEELNKRKQNFIWKDLDEVNILSSKVYKEWEPYFNKEFYTHFKQFGLTQAQASVYSRTLSYAAVNIINCIRDYYKDWSEFQILGFQDNKVSIAKGEVSASMSHFHKLIAYIDIKYTTSKKYNALKFLDYYINELNNAFFERTFLYEILDSEKKKLLNESVLEQIKLESKLQEQDFLSSSVKQEQLIQKDKSDLEKLKDKLFSNEEAFDTFEDLLDYFDIIDNITKRGNQAKFKAFWDCPSSNKVIFKEFAELSTYVDYLNLRFAKTYKSRSMSDGSKHFTSIKNYLSSK